MKLRFSLLVLAALSFAACSNSGQNNADSDTDLINNNKTASDPNAENPEPKMEFKHTTWDFGKITEGEVVTHTFKFTNTGNETLVITKCTASCGCTTPKCTSDPIPPGEEGEIVVKFDSHNRLNSQTKNITILANTVPPENVITIKSYVMQSEG